MKTRGVWDDKRQKFSAQETTQGPKKFREDIETLKIEKKPRDVIAHPHVEKKFWPTSLKNSVVALGGARVGRRNRSGRGRPKRGVEAEGEDEEQEGEERERGKQATTDWPGRKNRKERTIGQYLADHTFYAATNQQSNDRFAKMLIRER